MSGKLLHEEAYRGAETVAKLRGLAVTICGAGAVGSNLAESLARQGFASLRVIDHDKVEEGNLGTQIYAEADIGVWKVEALRNRLFRATGVEIEPLRKTFDASTGRALLKGSALVIDGFDNSAARACVQETARALALPCLHVGLHAEYFEVVWDEVYRVPADVNCDVCDYPLARNLALLAVAAAGDVAVRFAASGARESWAGTLRDFAIRPIEV